MASNSIISVDRTDSEKFAFFASQPSYDGPKNPLNQFRSYSYQFVLYLTASTADTERLGSATEAVDQYDQMFGRGDSHKSVDVDNYFDKYQVREFDGIKYITLINSFEDADLFIDELSHTAATSSTTTGSANSQSKTKSDLMQIGFDTSFKIFEPLGCRLLEILSKAHSDLGAVSPVYGLKIYFLGRKDELELSGSAAEYITSGPDDIGYFYALKPLCFILQDVQLNMTTEGTTYLVAVANIANGVGSPLGNNLSGSATVEKKDPTLQEVCTAFATSINQSMEKSKQYVDAAGNQSTVPVEYSVTFEDSLYQKEPDVKKHIKDSIVDNITNAQRGESGLIIQPPAVLNFPGKISFIVQLCSEITNLSERGAKTYSFAIATTTDITPEKIRYVVHVVRKKLPTIPVAEPSSSPAEQADKITGVALEAMQDGRLLHYQYYFSGRNVDVIKYDLSVTIGLNAIFSSFTPARSPNQNTIINNSDTNDAVTRSTTTESSDKAAKPNFGVQTTPSASRNLQNPASRDSFVDFMRQTMLGDNSTWSTMTIRGNPRLLQSSIVTTVGQTEDGQRTADKSDQIDQKNMSIDSLLVRLDVFSPSKKWNSTYTEELLPETTFKESFWHGGLFMLVTVKSTFVRGQFIQELQLSRIPSDANKPGIAKTTSENKPAGSSTKRTSADDYSKILANQPQGSCAREGLGKLSERYESGGRGPAAIGNDTTGGYSYGTYQIATKTGTFSNYMSYLQANSAFASIYTTLNNAGGAQAATYGDPAFKGVWVGLGSDPNFKLSQHNFIRDTHFTPQMQKIKRDTGLDVCAGHSNGLQDVVWSVAVQHGPGSGIITKAIKLVGAGASDKDIINAIYDERSKVDQYFSRSNMRERASVKARFDRERMDALAMT